MKISIPGHQYELPTYDPETGQEEHGHCCLLTFVCREATLPAREGTRTEDVLRALIDRTLHLDGQLPWDGNTEIVGLLRMALALSEARAIERKAERGEPIERYITGPDGHLQVAIRGALPNEAYGERGPPIEPIRRAVDMLRPEKPVD